MNHAVRTKAWVSWSLVRRVKRQAGLTEQRKPPALDMLINERSKGATDGFSNENFFTEGGYGPVYRGVLTDGQVVAVKQHKVVSAYGAFEFWSEIDVLRCAQHKHKNLEMLMGYCIEKNGSSS
ncbi:hypothetical protein HHK36_020742 [Tetracentron sinense]|uniref:Protein kinase domain-containing protein n=1 Tax=Tetracentron sinense TaxID=13715 RepID=A0A835DBB6_TETSI|nr:hypothetical protein HHK36_020742 [Tetracentron sinense]